MNFAQLRSSATSRWDRFWYGVVWLLGSLQSWVLRKYIRQHVWRSFNGEVRTPQVMTDSHLRNVVRYCERNEEADTPVYWAMRKELARRQLRIESPREEALLDLRSLVSDSEVQMIEGQILDVWHEYKPKPGTSEEDYAALVFSETVLRAFCGWSSGRAEAEPLDFYDFNAYVMAGYPAVKAARREYEQLLFGGKTDRRLRAEQTADA